MFFLGSFNSAIPYILYLSVIWAFMLIGLSGSIHFFRNTDQVVQEHHVSIHQHDRTYVAANLASAKNTGNSWFERTSNDYQTWFSVIIYDLNPPGIQFRSVRGYSSLISPRGPPVKFC